MTPPTARIWGRRGRTPIVRVRGRSRRRLPIAALARYKPGERARVIYRSRRDVESARCFTSLCFWNHLT